MNLISSLLGNPKESGFFPLDKKKVCNSREHNPPSHLHIPQGQGYQHVCPQCGKVTIIYPQQISL